MAEALKIFKKSYKVSIPAFEGPLDLLLYLIQKQELDIYDIPIAEITAQYLEYLEVMDFMDLEVAGEFLVMAATLMEIKSKMLLPPEPALDELEELDPRAQLVERLIEYQRFKTAALGLEQMEAVRRDYIAKAPCTLNEADEALVVEPRDEWWEVSLFDLSKAMAGLIRARVPQVVQEILEELITVEGKIRHLVGLLARYPVLYLSQIIAKARNRLDSIVSVLALLELAKVSQVSLDQKEIFGEVKIVRARSEQPRPSPVKAAR